MAFKDTGRWQEQLCDTSNHCIFSGSSSGLLTIADIAALQSYMYDVDIELARLGCIYEHL